MRTPVHLLNVLFGGMIQGPLRHTLLRPSTPFNSSNQQTLPSKPLLDRYIKHYKKHKEVPSLEIVRYWNLLGWKGKPKHLKFYFLIFIYLFILLAIKATLVAQSLNRAARFWYASVSMLPKEALPVHWTAGAADLVQWKWLKPALRKSSWLIPNWSSSSNFSSN